MEQVIKQGFKSKSSTAALAPGPHYVFTPTYLPHADAEGDETDNGCEAFASWTRVEFSPGASPSESRLERVQLT